jgi:hypothetical protein
MQTTTSDNPYRSPQAESGAGRSAAGDHSRWGLVAAIPLSLYAAFPLLFGAVGLLCVPGILTGGVSIGRATTPLRLAGCHRGILSLLYSDRRVNGCRLAGQDIALPRQVGNLPHDNKWFAGR